MGCLLSLPGAHNISDEIVYIHYIDFYTEDPYDILDENVYPIMYSFCD